MVIAPLSLRQDYWETFEIEERDLDFLYNHLLELETPLNTLELITALVEERIRQERINLENRKPQDGVVFIPKNQYEINQVLIFPAFNWQKGEVTALRAGNNPEFGTFDVIDVKMESGESRKFASGLEEHTLNRPIRN